MTEENKDVVEEIPQEQVESPVEEVTQEIDESKFNSAGDDGVFKVDLDKAPTKSEEVEKQPAEKEVEVVEEPGVVNEQPAIEEVEAEQQVQAEQQEVVEEVEKVVDEAVKESQASGEPLPENIQRLVTFMEETGGDLEDYVNLNRDVSKMDNSDVLDEYYRATKSHLTAEERSFLLEETFGYNEDEDDPKDIKRKKIALKEQVAEAKAYLDGQKSKYYEEIKSGVKLTEEQQKAINFFNRYNNETKEQTKLSEASKKVFLDKTNNLFNDKFKGFEYNVGDKRYRFNVKDASKVKETQSNLNNLINKFVGKDGVSLEDAAGYHKSLFTAMNADAVAKHFYEQGKADAVKQTVARDKNINLEPRKTFGETNVGGVKYRVLGQNSDDFKFKIKKKN